MKKKMQLSNGMSFLGPVRIGMTILLLIFIIFLQLGDRVSAAAIEDVEAAVIASISVDSMEKSTDRMFKKFYGLDPADYEAVVLYAPKTNMDVQELLIIKLSDTSQAEAVESAILSRLESQENTFEGYAPEQYAMLEDHHVLDIRGNYVLYIVHEDAGAADSAFKSAL